MSDVEAHITGTVWKIEVAVGDEVAEGDTVVILESTKMEMPVEAEDPGTVAEIRCEEGPSVSAGDTLSDIADSTLGDQSQWPALFELNRGAKSPDGTHALTNPNVIWSGLRLRLPPVPTANSVTLTGCRPGTWPSTMISPLLQPTMCDASPVRSPTERRWGRRCAGGAIWRRNA